MPPPSLFKPDSLRVWAWFVAALAYCNNVVAVLHRMLPKSLEGKEGASLRAVSNWAEEAQGLVARGEIGEASPGATGEAYLSWCFARNAEEQQRQQLRRSRQRQQSAGGAAAAVLQTPALPPPTTPSPAPQAAGSPSPVTPSAVLASPSPASAPAFEQPGSKRRRSESGAQSGPRPPSDELKAALQQVRSRSRSSESAGLRAEVAELTKRLKGVRGSSSLVKDLEAAQRSAEKALAEQQKKVGELSAGLGDLRKMFETLQVSISAVPRPAAYDPAAAAPTPAPAAPAVPPGVLASLSARWEELTQMVSPRAGLSVEAKLDDVLDRLTDQEHLTREMRERLGDHPDPWYAEGPVPLTAPVGTRPPRVMTFPLGKLEHRVVQHEDRLRTLEKWREMSGTDDFRIAAAVPNEGYSDMTPPPAGGGGGPGVPPYPENPRVPYHM